MSKFLQTPESRMVFSTVVAAVFYVLATAWLIMLSVGALGAAAGFLPVVGLVISARLLALLTGISKI